MSLSERLSILLTCFLMLLALFIYFVKNSPEGQRWLSRWHALWHTHQSQEQFEQALRRDPPKGFQLANLPLSPSPIDIRPSLPVLVIVFGACEGCMSKEAEEAAEVLGRWETWRKNLKGVLVFQDKKEKVTVKAEEWKAKGWMVQVVADEDGKISESLNAFFSPRAYGFVNGKLVWVQKEPKMSITDALERFLLFAEGEEKTNQLMKLWSAELREAFWGKEMAELAKGGKQK